jgi:tRNA uracil 4-sulfurtransferase
VNALVAHYHEVGLKGRNREFFEHALARNLRRALRGTGYKRLRHVFGRMIIDFHPDNAFEEASTRAARVFGVANIGAGKLVSADMNDIVETAQEMMLAEPFESFSVRARRTYSTMPNKSAEINSVVGQAIKDRFRARVDLGHPDATLHVELFGNSGIVYRDRRRGPGGLPVGVSGRMMALLSGGIDSPVAAWRMMRRGAEVELVHFHGQPFTDPSSVRQVTELSRGLALFQLKVVLHLIPLGDIQQAIAIGAPAPLRTILYRRAMIRLAGLLARDREALAVVTGDSLGQVASQTMHNLRTIDAASSGVPVYRPLIGMDKMEIIDSARAIGTLDTSTTQYQDCCVLFEPRSPATRSFEDQTAAAEAPLELDELIDKALASIETLELELPSP